MPTITKIHQRPKAPNRTTIYLDGRSAFSCHVNVAARFRLRVGMQLTEETIREIQIGGTRQKCLDRALRYLTDRLHARAELVRKLHRAGFDPDVIDETLIELARLGYVNDKRFAVERLAVLEKKGRSRMQIIADLEQRGIGSDVAKKAIDAHCTDAQQLDAARKLAVKNAARLKGLPLDMACRRLAGMLSRRGFSRDLAERVIDETLGGRVFDEAEGN